MFLRTPTFTLWCYTILFILNICSSHVKSCIIVECLINPNNPSHSLLHISQIKISIYLLLSKYMENKIYCKWIDVFIFEDQYICTQRSMRKLHSIVARSSLE